jgi:hypothetical protein
VAPPLGTAQAHVFASPDVFYRAQYFSFLGAVTSHMTSRFQQPGMKTYADMEAPVVAVSEKLDFTAYLDRICEVYDDFDKKELKRQLNSCQAFAHFHAILLLTQKPT